MKVFFIDTVHQCLEQQLSSKGFECTDVTTASRSELLQNIHQADGIVIRSRTPIDKEFLDAATSLKFIARAGAGMENIDILSATSKGIKLFSAPEGNRDAVAEHAMGMLLSLFNHLKRVDSEVRKGVWLRAENRGYELKGKTVGLIGFGFMGKALALRLKGFGCTIIAYDKYLGNYGNSDATACSLKELQDTADIISLHIPQTEECVHLIDDAFIEKCTKPFYLINTARGKNVKTSALVNGLESGKVLGACLDVLEYEKASFENFFSDDTLPEPLQYLITSEKVILSPHIAGWTHESHRKLSQVLFDKIEAAFKL